MERVENEKIDMRGFNIGHDQSFINKIKFSPKYASQYIK